MSYSISLDESVINSFLAGIKGISTLHIPIDVEHQNYSILTSKLRLKLYSTIGRSEMDVWLPGKFKIGNYYFSNSIKNFRVVANDFKDKKNGDRSLGDIEFLENERWILTPDDGFERLYFSHMKFDIRLDEFFNDKTSLILVRNELAKSLAVDTSLFHEKSDYNNSFVADIFTSLLDVKFTNINKAIQTSIGMCLIDNNTKKFLLPTTHWYHKKSGLPHLVTHSCLENKLPPYGLPKILNAQNNDLLLITDSLEIGNFFSSNNSSFIVTTWVGGKDYIDNTDWDCLRGKANVHYVCVQHSGNTEESQLETYNKLKSKLKNYDIDLRMTNLYNRFNGGVPPVAVPTMTNPIDVHQAQASQVTKRPINAKNILWSSTGNSESAGSILDPFIFRDNISLIETDDNIDISSLGMTFACASALAKSAFNPEKTSGKSDEIKNAAPPKVRANRYPVAQDKTNDPALPDEVKCCDDNPEQAEKNASEPDVVNAPQAQSIEASDLKSDSTPSTTKELATKSGPPQKMHLKWKSNSKSFVLYISTECDYEAINNKFDIIRKSFGVETNELRDSVSMISIGENKLSLANEKDRDSIREVIYSISSLAQSRLIIFDDIGDLLENSDAWESAFQWLREMTDIKTGILILNRMKIEDKNISKIIHNNSNHIIRISSNNNVFSNFNPIIITPIKGRELMKCKPISVVLNTRKITEPKWGITKLNERDTFERRKKVEMMVKSGKTIAFMANELVVSTKTISQDKKSLGLLRNSK